MGLKRFLTGLSALLLLSVVAIPARAETDHLRITKQYGVIYLPLVIMQHDKLIEKYAEKLGLHNLKVDWMTFTGGAAASSALLAGQVDLLCTGTSTLLILWDKSNGGVKGVMSASSTPMWLLTRNPKIKSLKDFTEKDRIALPTAKVSTQALMLQIAATKQMGFEKAKMFNNISVSLGHPDGMAALSNPHGEIDSHFSGPPYQEREAKMPGVRVLLKSNEVAGNHSNATFFGMTNFINANPKTMQALREALEEADAMIKRNPHRAAQEYLEVTHEKTPVDEIVRIISKPENVYSTTPFGTMKFANFMYKAGYIHKKPKSWKDVYVPAAYNLPGS